MKSTWSTNLCWPWSPPQKWAKNIQKESKTSVFDSFLTESVISVNVDGSPSWTRTNDPAVNSRMLYRLSYRGMKSSNDLIFRAVARKVPSAQMSLTSVFGMGTGGASSPSSLLWYIYGISPGYISLDSVCLLFPATWQLHRISFLVSVLLSAQLNIVRISFRFNSLSSHCWDQALDLLVSVSLRITALTPPTYQPHRLWGVLLTYVMGYLILRRVSRLDAFSVYLIRTSLPCRAAGATTGAQLVRSSRSSRTRDKASQISYAHDG